MTLAELLARPERWPVLLLAPAAWVALRLLDSARARRRARALGARERAISDASERRRAGRRATFAAGLLLALSALLHPSFGAPVPEDGWRGVDVVLALDVSRSMLARDLAPDRLSRAKAEIRRLAERAKGDRLGLVVFAGEARTLVPRTSDLASLATLADLADPTAVRRGGTDLGAALAEAGRSLAGESSAPAAVVLLTDGEDLGGRGLEEARRLATKGVVVHAVGLATEGGGKVAVPGDGGETFLKDRTGRDVVSSLDREGLARIAEATGGRFVEAEGADRPLVDLYEREVLPTARAAYERANRTRREDRYQLPLALALMLLLADLALTDRGTAVRRRAPPARVRVAVGVGVVLLALSLAACGRSAEERAELEKARATFLRGNEAYARAIEAEAAIGKPGADPAIRERAATWAEDALAAWRSAAATRSDWPAARRNVERALLALKRLREKGAEGGVLEIPHQIAEPTEDPDAASLPAPPDEEPPEVPVEVQAGDLAPGDVMKVLDLVAAKEREKQDARRRLRDAQPGGVERDW